MSSVADVLISEFRRRALKIDCSEVHLTQHVAGNPIRFRGAGYIAQGDDGNLVFRVDAAEVQNTDARAAFKTLASWKAGTLREKTEYYSLSAIATDGTVWTAESVYPVCKWAFDRPTAGITGSVTLLQGVIGAASRRNAVRAHFFEDAELPTIGGRSEFSGCGKEFIFCRSDGYFWVEACSKDRISPHIQDRISEALRFLLAKSVQWRAAEIFSEGRHQILLCSALRKSARTLMDPPITLWRGDLFRDQWRLFAHYLDYVERNTPTAAWNRCSYHLYNACESSANSLDAWAVGVAVAAEGLASQVKVKTPVPHKNVVGRLRAAVRSVLEANSEFRGLVERADGLLGTLSTIRVQDRLSHLVSEGRVDSNLVRAWSRLRHKHVHPGPFDLRESENYDHGVILRQINQVTVLIYQIVFSLIGYTGKFTDYTTVGYPIRDYPLRPEQ